MNRLHTLITIAFCFSLAGVSCSASQPGMRSWVGQSETAFVSQWGDPEVTETLDDQRTRSFWIVEWPCRVVIYSNENNIIDEAHYQSCDHHAHTAYWTGALTNAEPTDDTTTAESIDTPGSAL